MPDASGSGRDARGFRFRIFHCITRGKGRSTANSAVVRGKPAPLTNRRRRAMMRHRKLVAVLVVLCFAASGCIGSFGAFNKLLSWNKSVTPNKWGNELIFLALNIIPVYGLAMLGDMLIFNAIEFWGGDNPMRAESVVDGEHKAVQIFNQDSAGKHMTVSYYEGNSLDHTLSLSQAAPGAPMVGRIDWA